MTIQLPPYPIIPVQAPAARRRENAPGVSASAPGISAETQPVLEGQLLSRASLTRSTGSAGSATGIGQSLDRLRHDPGLIDIMPARAVAAYIGHEAIGIDESSLSAVGKTGWFIDTYV